LLKKEKGEVVKLKKYLTSSLIVLSLLAATMLLPMPARASPDAPVLVVEPNVLNFQSDIDPPGKSFQVSVWIRNVNDSAKFYGWEFALYWDAGEINCTGQTLNTAIWTPYGGPWVPFPINNTVGRYHQSLTGQAPATPKSGDFWLVNLTFIIVASPPPMPGAEVYTDLTLATWPPATFCIADITATPIYHTYDHGEYHYRWAPPTVVAYLEVDPDSYTATALGEEFDIDILIHDVNPGWWLAGTEFLFTYNTSVLDALSVTQGTFFEPYTTTTFFYEYIDESMGKIRIAYTILDIPSYTSPATGNGLIATIHFNATAQGMFPIVLWSDLILSIDTEAGVTSFFANKFADEIPYGTAQNGYYEIIPKVTGRVIDVYVCNYPSPFGGQGPNRPSDMFWPQKEVCLCANVSYNEWPEQSKDVAFQIIDPYGDTWAILYARTNENGTAKVCFRLPWPCDDPEHWLGEWTVIATVDIACIIVNDTLTFHYDYIVHIVKITTDKPEYAHCAYMNIIVDFKSKKMIPMNVTITVTALDETGVPFGFAYVELEIGGAIYCHYKNYTISVSIHVIKWARAGTGTIVVGALDDWPFLLGNQISAPFNPKTIRILAEWA
jgi:hypothetical protein